MIGITFDDLKYLDNSRSNAVHTASNDFIANVLGNRLGFPGNHGLIHIGCTSVNDTIRRNS